MLKFPISSLRPSVVLSKRNLLRCWHFILIGPAQITRLLHTMHYRSIYGCMQPWHERLHAFRNWSLSQWCFTKFALFKSVYRVQPAAVQEEHSFYEKPPASQQETLLYKQQKRSRYLQCIYLSTLPLHYFYDYFYGSKIYCWLIYSMSTYARLFLVNRQGNIPVFILWTM